MSENFVGNVRMHVQTHQPVKFSVLKITETEQTLDRLGNTCDFLFYKET